MLTITPEASHAIRGILSASDAPDGSMFRISPQQQNGTGSGATLTVSVIDVPPPDDEIVEGEEVAVDIEPTAAALLEDKKLDATVVGDQINFSIAEQAA
jgi:Fe-S cluster assembly iron-binding protein IscA